MMFRLGTAPQPFRPALGLVLLFGLLSPATTFAQPGLRDLSGMVRDHHHEPLNDAIVYLENSKTRNVVTFRTDRSGHYSFKRLSGDTDYDVWAVYRERQSKHLSLSQFDTKPTPVLDLVITPE